MCVIRQIKLHDASSLVHVENGSHGLYLQSLRVTFQKHI